MIYKFESTVRKNQKRLLLEAYRRVMTNTDEQAIKDTWVGLGYESDFRNSRNFFKPLGRLNTNMKSWWLLSDKGTEIVSDMVEKIEWSEQVNTQIVDWVDKLL